jgi:hypothetical protein
VVEFIEREPYPSPLDPLDALAQVLLIARQDAQDVKSDRVFALHGDNHLAIIRED